MKIKPSKFMIFFACFYFCLDFLCLVLGKKAIVTPTGTVLAVTFVSSAGFMLEDVVTEAYGIKATMSLVKLSTINKILTDLFCCFLLSFPIAQPAFRVIFHHALTVTLVAVGAYFIAKWLNAYFLIKWKIMLKGRYFWLRSSMLSGIFETLFAIIFSISAMYLFKNTNILFNSNSIAIIISSCIVRFLMNLLLAFPFTILVLILKAVESKPKSLLFSNPFNTNI